MIRGAGGTSKFRVCRSAPSMGGERIVLFDGTQQRSFLFFASSPVGPALCAWRTESGSKDSRCRWHLEIPGVPFRALEGPGMALFVLKDRNSVPFCFSRHHPSDRLCAHGAQNPVRKIRGAGGTSKFRVCCSVPLRARNGIVCPHSAILFCNLRPGQISCVGFIMWDFFAKIVI